MLPTIRVEFHRIARDAQTAPVRETGSSVYTVFDGSGTVTVGDKTWSVEPRRPVRRPVLAAVLGQVARPGATDSDSGALDLFRFSDSPVFEALKLSRVVTEAAP